MGKWQILYLRTRNISKLGWFFWFSPMHVMICRNLVLWPVKLCEYIKLNNSKGSKGRNRENISEIFVALSTRTYRSQSIKSGMASPMMGNYFIALLHFKSEAVNELSTMCTMHPACSVHRF